MFSRITLISILALLFSSPVGWACSCAAPPPPKNALEKSAAVFVGKVTKIDRRADAGILLVTIEVQATWKGTKDKLVVVQTRADGEACGFAFEAGKTYLVYCYESGEEGKKVLTTNMCTRTRVFDDVAKKEVEEFGPAKMPSV